MGVRRISLGDHMRWNDPVPILRDEIISSSVWLNNEVRWNGLI
jgi:hypothetical protein